MLRYFCGQDHGPGRSGPLEAVEYRREFVLETSTARVIEGDLHAYLDQMQMLVMDLAGSLGRLFFRDWQPEPMRATQGQG